MTNHEYFVCFSEAMNYDDIDAYVSDTSLSSMWGEISDDERSRTSEELKEIYKAAHRSVKDISKLSGMSIRQLAMRFGIPQRSIENWSVGSRECPAYVLMMMQECLGMMDVKRGKGPQDK